MKNLILLFLLCVSFADAQEVLVQNYKEVLHIENVKEKDTLFFENLKKNNIWEVEKYITHNKYNYAETIIVTNYQDVLNVCEKYSIDKSEGFPILNYIMVTIFEKRKSVKTKN